jgi:hypothetical protein
MQELFGVRAITPIGGAGLVMRNSALYSTTAPANHSVCFCGHADLALFFDFYVLQGLTVQLR